MIEVDQPLFLITQAQRSGGTLLLRLLDGHPELHVVPFQLRGIDQAAKRMPETSAQAWSALHDPRLVERYEEGYRQRKGAVLDDDVTHSFELDPERQREVYDECAAALDRPATRDLFACYFTSYFSAWRDYAGGGSARWLVGFEPGVVRSLRRRQALHEIYPDGRGISIVRDPWSWYASARRWEPQWQNREVALDHWCRTSAGALKWRTERKEAERKAGMRKRGVDLISFDALLRDTETTMRRLAAWLGIEFRPELLRPTFNGRPIRANTSFSDVDTGVSSKPLGRARDELDAEDVDYIEQHCGALYRRLAAKAEHDLRMMDPV
jgi:sulfotransferase family protein